MKQKVVNFKCAACHLTVDMEAAAITDEGLMFLVGHCICGQQVLINIDKVITMLVSDRPKTNEC